MITNQPSSSTPNPPLPILSESRRERRLIFSGRSAYRTWELLVVQLDKFGRGITDVGTLKGAGLQDLKKAVQVITPSGCNRSVSLEREKALQLLATGILAGNIAGRPVPDKVMHGAGERLVEGLWEIIEQTGDAYLCSQCARPLAPGVQVAMVESIQRGSSAVLVYCDACKNTPCSHGEESEGRDHLEADYHRAVLLFAAHQHGHALYHLNRQISTGPAHHLHHQLKSMLLMEMGRMDEALEEVLTFERLAPPQLAREVAVQKVALAAEGRGVLSLLDRNVMQVMGRGFGAPMATEPASRTLPAHP